MQRLAFSLIDRHDPRLLLLSLFVCLFASITAAGLLRRALSVAGRLRGIWLGGAALAFGSGVWATHFIAMLAYLPADRFGYAIPPTALSLLRAIVGILAAFAIAFGGRAAPWRVALGGVTLGGAVAVMHFTGMAAMRPAHAVSFIALYAVAALAAGIVFGTAALVAMRRRQHALAVLCAMLTVCGVHFIAIAGTTLGAPALDAAAPSLLANVSPQLLTNGPLAVAVGALTVLLLSLALVGAVIDHHLARRAQDEAARLRRFADATFEGILFLRNDLVIDANASVCTLLGRTREALLGRPLGAFLTLTHTTGVLAGNGATEAELIDIAGTRRPVELLSRPLAEAARTDVVVAVRDITDRKRAEARIQHLAHHDRLTDLPNRALFQERLAQAMSMADRTGHALALLSLDLDGFKAVNELFGHPVGDRVLVEVGNRLRACLRETDTVARLGSDEFAVVQSFSDQPCGALGLAERIMRLLAEPFVIEDHRVSIGTSIGMTLYPADGRTPEQLLRNAGLALYRAKQDGRGLTRFFEPQMDARLQERRQLEQDLREALRRNELRLHYQPLLDSRTLTVEGFEALLRWQHPVRGMVSPAKFVPVAEECGLISAFGQWVLETACAEAASWPLPWRVAVNLSPVQFRQPDLAGSIRDVLARTGLPASRLELEITEGVLIDDADRALAALRELKALGVGIALDDFGTGYSSLSYLQRFPFDKLKIDASFVQGLGDNGEADAIVRAIVALGRSLSLHITAEGVETDNQLQLLRAQCCDQVQGYLLGRPMPPADIPLLRGPVLESA